MQIKSIAWWMLSGQLASARMLDPAEPLRVVLERPVHCTEPHVSHLQSERAGSDELSIPPSLARTYDTH